MTTTDRVISQGRRDSQGPATWSQRFMWDAMQTQPEPVGRLSWHEGGLDKEWLLESEDILHRAAAALPSAPMTTAGSPGSRPRSGEVR